MVQPRLQAKVLHHSLPSGVCFRHLDIYKAVSHLPQVLSVLPCKSAGRIHKGDDGEPKLVGMLHEAQGLAIPVGLGHAKVAVDVFLQEQAARVCSERLHTGRVGNKLLFLVCSSTGIPLHGTAAYAVGSFAQKC